MLVLYVYQLYVKLMISPFDMSFCCHMLLLYICRTATNLLLLLLWLLLILSRTGQYAIFLGCFAGHSICIYLEIS